MWNSMSGVRSVEKVDAIAWRKQHSIMAHLTNPTLSITIYDILMYIKRMLIGSKFLNYAAFEF